MAGACKIGFIFLLLASTCFGISQQEIIFRNGDITLSGTLLLPESPKPHPGIILLHGSGPSVRSPYELYARAFTDAGYASLIFDKRGCGKSKGSWTSASLNDLAQDASAAISFLKSRSDINPKAVGIWAVSQSAWIVPLLQNLPFVIVVTGGGATPHETEMYGYRNEWKHAGLSAGEEKEAEHLLQLYFQYLKSGKGLAELESEIKKSKEKRWYRLMPLDKILPDEASRKNWEWVPTFDPMPYIKKMKMPILLLFGGKDFRTPTTLAVQRWKQGLSEAGNKQFEIKVFPDASHAIRAGEHHGVGHSEADFAPGYFETMTEWLKRIALTFQ